MTITSDCFALCIGTPEQRPHYFMQDCEFKPIKDITDLAFTVEFETEAEAIEALAELPGDLSSAYVVKMHYDIILKVEPV